MAQEKDFAKLFTDEELSEIVNGEPEFVEVPGKRNKQGEIYQWRVLYNRKDGTRPTTGPIVGAAKKRQVENAIEHRRKLQEQQEATTQPIDMLPQQTSPSRVSLGRLGRFAAREMVGRGLFGTSSGAFGMVARSKYGYPGPGRVQDLESPHEEQTPASVLGSIRSSLAGMLLNRGSGGPGNVANDEVGRAERVRNTNTITKINETLLRIEKLLGEKKTEEKKEKEPGWLERLGKIIGAALGPIGAVIASIGAAIAKFMGYNLLAKGLGQAGGALLRGGAALGIAAGSRVVRAARSIARRAGGTAVGRAIQGGARAVAGVASRVGALGAVAGSAAGSALSNIAAPIMKGMGGIFKVIKGILGKTPLGLLISAVLNIPGAMEEYEKEGLGAAIERFFAGMISDFTFGLISVEQIKKFWGGIKEKISEWTGKIFGWITDGIKKMFSFFTSNEDEETGDEISVQDDQQRRKDVARQSIENTIGRRDELKKSDELNTENLSERLRIVTDLARKSKDDDGRLAGLANTTQGKLRKGNLQEAAADISALEERFGIVNTKPQHTLTEPESMASNITPPEDPRAGIIQREAQQNSVLDSRQSMYSTPPQQQYAPPPAAGSSGGAAGGGRSSPRSGGGKGISPFSQRPSDTPTAAASIF